MIKIINVFLMAFSVCTYAINVSNVDFYATQICPLYISKNQRTNPDNLMTQLNTVYPVYEFNKPKPDWLRVALPNKELRWVSSSCGYTQQNDQATKSCDSAGMADSYVLALSSQPGFCETYGFEAGKPECRKLNKNSYQANHLTLHGLWPNIDICGQHYGFCNARPLANHCDYEPLRLSHEVSEQLKKIMPSFNYGSCLERHEWNKHGTCQILSADDYFSLAMRLVSEADSSPFGKYLTAHQGQTVTLSSLREALNETFGKTNGEKIYLGCKSNILVDIYIQLPAVITQTDNLITLVNKAPRNYQRDTCNQKVIISHFNKDLWF